MHPGTPSKDQPISDIVLDCLSRLFMPGKGDPTDTWNVKVEKLEILGRE